MAPFHNPEITIEPGQREIALILDNNNMLDILAFRVVRRRTDRRENDAKA